MKYSREHVAKTLCTRDNFPSDKDLCRFLESKGFDSSEVPYRVESIWWKFPIIQAMTAFYERT